MRIKRFIATDMRSALRMVRDEQGPDAVILSNRVIADGTIEVVAATDYDESLVQQALRAAAPGLETIAVAQVAAVAVPAPTHHSPATAPHDRGVSSIAAQLAASAPVRISSAAMAAASAAEAAAPTMPAAPVAPAAQRAAPAPRESLVSRARAVFKVNDGPTLAELAQAAAATSPTTTNDAAASATDAPVPTRFEAMMAAINNTAAPIHAPAPVAPLAIAATTVASTTTASTTTTATAAPTAATTTNNVASVVAQAEATFAAARAALSTPIAAQTHADDWAGSDDDYHVTLSAVAAPIAPRDEVLIESSVAIAPQAVAAPALQIIASTEPDPSIVAMRADLATMRVLMERQMEQLSVERLRGSPARAAAYDALIGYGCEDVLAQAVAARIDPRLDPLLIQAPMFAELARMLTIARSEPLEEGGVIALVGPTGAGKTTTAAKLAARFAARHRARDVALVTTDNERAGAREQLHAHGRRLGITVCEAAGPEGLADALAQLSDYPLVLVDTTGHAPRDRALFAQILWLRAARKVRSLLVLPANAHPHDLGEVIRRYRPAAPEGVVLTKLDETGRLGSALSVAVRHGLTLAYTTYGQQVPADIDIADATRLAQTLEKLRRAADNPLATEDRHAIA